MIIASAASANTQMINTVIVFLGTFVACMVGLRPLRAVIDKYEKRWDFILRNALLLETSGRVITIATGFMVILFGFIGAAISGSVWGAVLIGALGLFPPNWYVNYKRQKRIQVLEEQLVSAIQMLASGVRAGLNLIQSMQLIARDGAIPVRQEFAHLVNEYEYGIPLNQSMINASERIGSTDYRLLFSALQTHRERGGDLAKTLDEIADSIREIQRLEGRVKSLTAQGRSQAKCLGAMPGIVMLICSTFDPVGVKQLFTTTSGNVILGIIFLCNVIGFLWIRKIMQVDL